MLSDVHKLSLYTLFYAFIHQKITNVCLKNSTFNPDYF